MFHDASRALIGKAGATVWEQDRRSSRLECRIYRNDDTRYWTKTKCGSGSNWGRQDDECNIRKGCAPKSQRDTTRLSLHVAGDIDSAGPPGQFIRSSSDAVSGITGVSTSRFINGNLRGGSIIYEVEVLAGKIDEQTPGEAAKSFSTYLESGGPLWISGQ